jgi:hypothetical protein
MSLPPEITTRRDDRHGSRLGDIIRKLSSDSDGEIVATIHALRRVLESSGVDVHALADHIENGHGLTEADKQEIQHAVESARADGYADGVRAAEARQNGAGTFRNTDGKLDWTEVALFVQREKHRLPDKHHEFIDDMAARSAWGREPTQKQHQYLHSLFYKLGGRIRT